MVTAAYNSVVRVLCANWFALSFVVLYFGHKWWKAFLRPPKV